MQLSQAYQWLIQGPSRHLIITKLLQPMTAKQLARKTDLDLDFCSYTLGELAKHQLVSCLNPNANRSRLYWLTSLGKACQQRGRGNLHLPPLIYDMPVVDWDLYGWICFNHRKAVIKALKEPMQPATIKRRAKFDDPDLRMSANNVRDVIRLFLQKKIVRPVQVKKKAHLRYELTEEGNMLRQLLMNAD